MKRSPQKLRKKSKCLHQHLSSKIETWTSIPIRVMALSTTSTENSRSTGRASKGTATQTDSIGETSILSPEAEAPLFLKLCFLT